MLVVGWGLIQLLVVRPQSFIGQWNDWRQADTMQIAINFLEEPRLLHPRIAWGGDGPGYVETELQIYGLLVAGLSGLTGWTELAGQLVSWSATVMAACVLLGLFRRLELGSTACLLGLAFFLSSRLVVGLSVSVMPEMVCLALYVASLWLLVELVDKPRSIVLLAGLTLSTAAAALIKPTVLHLGIVQFLFVLVVKPSLLKGRIWVGWAVVLGVVGAQLRHSLSLYERWGNGFGVLSSADSKFPGIEQLLMPGSYRALVEATLAWGLGWVGAAAALGCLVSSTTRSYRALVAALLVGNAAGLLVSLRYSSSPWMGAHYHLFSVVAGSLAVAVLWNAGEPRVRQRREVLTAIAVVALIGLCLRYAGSMQWYAGEASSDSPLRTLGKELAELSAPDELVVVRSAARSTDADWSRANNYQDPRVFYVAQRRGWVLAADDEMPSEALETWHGRGARFYVEPYGDGPSVALESWLGSNGSLVVDEPAGRIWRLDRRRGGSSESDTTDHRSIE